MADRTCKICSQTKPLNLFNGYMCNKCKNKQTVLKRKQKRLQAKISESVDVKLNKDDMQLYDLLMEAMSIVVSGNHDNEYTELIDKLYETLNVAENVGKKILSFPYEVSPSTYSYLSKVFEGNNDLRTAESMMRAQRFNPQFKAVYGLGSDIEDVYDEVIAIRETTDAIKTAYNEMVDVVNSENKQKSKFAGNQKTETMEHTWVYFSLMSQEVIVEDNSLQYDTEQFSQKLIGFINDKNLTIQGYYSAGRYDTIL